MAQRVYTPTLQRQVRGFENGQSVELYEIHYDGPNGVSGWIRVPVRSATPELVDTLIRRQLDTQLAISQLGAGEG